MRARRRNATRAGACVRAERLVRKFQTLTAHVAFSGYDHPVYQPLVEAGWIKCKWDVTCSVAGRTRNSQLKGRGKVKELQPRTDCLWVKPHAGGTHMQTDMFEGGQ